MKLRKVYYIAVISVVVTVFSCKKSFVDLEPKGQFLSANYYADKDQAFAWLQKMFEVRSQYPLRLKVQPDFDNLQSDPRFADWLQRLNLAR